MPTSTTEPVAEVGAVPISDEVWEEQGRDLARRLESSAWEIGDWLVRGEQIDGKPCDPNRYQRAVSITRIGYGTLRNRASVARAFDVSRRRDTVSFAHHAVVARKQDADAWLDKAAKNNWSEKMLRLKVSEVRGKRSSSSGPMTRIVLVVEAAKADAWLKAAGRKDAKDGVFKEWVVEQVQKGMAA
jgi:hypothetical protein